MPLLDIAIAQASLQNHLGSLRSQSIFHCKVLSSPFTVGDEKRLVSVWKSFRLPETANTYGRNKLLIKAVAMLEPKCLGHNNGGHESYRNMQLDVNSDPSTFEVESSSSDPMESRDRESLRRIRISRANKGNTPWNKGRKHTAETIQRIKERTRLAMQDPKIRMKLANLGHAQSMETRTKISIGVRMRWQKRHEKQMLQETCFFEWQNLIAEASRRGYVGEEELQWDSYQILSEKLDCEWLETVKQRKAMPRPKGNKRAPKSLEQRRKIAEAIAAKWADPAYRERVHSGLSNYYGKPVGVEKKTRRKPSGGAQSTKWEPLKKKTFDTNNSLGSDTTSPIQQVRLRRSKTPLYKDPLASSKLEMIKNIREQRVVTETMKIQAIERARLLIAEAEKAAKALEVAATKSPIARASLIETRKLIAEAIQSIESIDTGRIMPNENDRHPPLASTDLVSQAGLRAVNGIKNLTSSKDEGLNFINFTIHDVLNVEKESLPTSSNGHAPAFNLESLIEQSDSEKQCGLSEPSVNLESEKSPLPSGSKIDPVKKAMPSKSGTTKKKWVRGRLVEVIEDG